MPVLSSPAAVKKKHRLCGLNTTHGFSPSSGGWKFKGKGPADEVLGEAASWLAGGRYPEVHMRWGGSSGPFLTPPWGPHLHPSSKPDHLPKTPPPKSITWGVRAPACEVAGQGAGGNTHADMRERRPTLLKGSGCFWMLPCEGLGRGGKHRLPGPFSLS